MERTCNNMRKDNCIRIFAGKSLQINYVRIKCRQINTDNIKIKFKYK